MFRRKKRAAQELPAEVAEVCRKLDKVRRKLPLRKCSNSSAHFLQYSNQSRKDRTYSTAAASTKQQRQQNQGNLPAVPPTHDGNNKTAVSVRVNNIIAICISP